MSCKVLGLVALATLGSVQAMLTPRTSDTKISKTDTLPRQVGRMAPAQQWGVDPVRGVNLGGWLVLEPWITPSLFETKPEWVVDERSYGAYMLSQPDKGEIYKHWETWITYEDFEQIAEARFNTVRIPVGFWSLTPLVNGETFMVGAFDHLKNGVNWARNVGLKVMLDLHGAPGGQNTWDNSGLRGTREWFANYTNMDRTLHSLQVLMKEFNKPEWANTVTSIEVLNEPFPQNEEQEKFLKLYYEAAYSQVRNQSPATPEGGGIVVVMSEAYRGLEYWKDWMPSPAYQRASLDLHVYHMFDEKMLGLTWVGHLLEYCRLVPELTQSNTRLWTIVGEFTAAPTDCASWLHGGANVAKWTADLMPNETMANPNDCHSISRNPSSWTQEYRDYLTRSWETQIHVYEQAAGWIAWTWKTETAMDWSVKAGLEGGWLTQPGQRKFETPCGLELFTNVKSVAGAPGVTATTAWMAAAAGAAWLFAL